MIKMDTIYIMLQRTEFQQKKKRKKQKRTLKKERANRKENFLYDTSVQWNCTINTQFQHHQDNDVHHKKSSGHSKTVATLLRSLTKVGSF